MAAWLPGCFLVAYLAGVAAGGTLLHALCCALLLFLPHPTPLLLAMHPPDVCTHTTVTHMHAH